MRAGVPLDPRIAIALRAAIGTYDGAFPSARSRRVVGLSTFRDEMSRHSNRSLMKLSKKLRQHGWYKEQYRSQHPYEYFAPA